MKKSPRSPKISTVAARKGIYQPKRIPGTTLRFFFLNSSPSPPPIRRTPSPPPPPHPPTPSHLACAIPPPPSPHPPAPSHPACAIPPPPPHPRPPPPICRVPSPPPPSYPRPHRRIPTSTGWETAVGVSSESAASPPPVSVSRIPPGRRSLPGVRRLLPSCQRLPDPHLLVPPLSTTSLPHPCRPPFRRPFPPLSSSRPPASLQSATGDDPRRLPTVRRPGLSASPRPPARQEPCKSFVPPSAVLRPDPVRPPPSRPPELHRFDSIICFDLPDQQSRPEIAAQYAKHWTKSELIQIFIDN